MKIKTAVVIFIGIITILLIPISTAAHISYFKMVAAAVEIIVFGSFALFLQRRHNCI